MKQIYKFITGNSRVTPVGAGIAVIIAALLHGKPGIAVPIAYLAILLLTLAASALEPVQ